MQKFNNFTSKIIPLPLADIDTDMIIPAQYLTRTEKGGWGEFLFFNLKANDPNFIFNQSQQIAGKQILVARNNFGCGSSREHAVWALVESGIKAVIAPEFADIFKTNSGKNGLLTIEMPAEVVEDFLRQADDLELSINLAEQEITDNFGKKYTFDYNHFVKKCILNGYDDLSYILSHKDSILDWDKQRQAKIFNQTVQ